MAIRIKIKTVDTGIKIHPIFTDAWHLFKMLMIIFIIAAIITYKGMELWYYLPLSYIAWNGCFLLFYRYIFRTKIKEKSVV